MATFDLAATIVSALTSTLTKVRRTITNYHLCGHARVESMKTLFIYLLLFGFLCLQHIASTSSGTRPRIYPSGPVRVTDNWQDITCQVTPEWQPNHSVSALPKSTTASSDAMSPKSQLIAIPRSPPRLVQPPIQRAWNQIGKYIDRSLCASK